MHKILVCVCIVHAVYRIDRKAVRRGRAGVEPIDV